jgi:hypothetical protein
LNASTGALLERYQARRFNDQEAIEFAGAGVVILARDYPDGTSTLVTSMFARNNAGNVGRSLLHVQWAAGRGHAHYVFIVPVEKLYEASRIQMEFHALCEPDRDDVGAADPASAKRHRV